MTPCLCSMLIVWCLVWWSRTTMSNILLSLLRSGEQQHVCFAGPSSSSVMPLRFAPIPLPSAASRLNSSSCNRRRCYELPAIRSLPSSTSSASAGLQAHGPPPTHPPSWRASRLPHSSPTFAGSAVAGCISSPWASSSFTSRITTSVSRAPVSACCPAKARLCVGLHVVTRRICRGMYIALAWVWL